MFLPGRGTIKPKGGDSMKYEELFQLATETSKDVLQKNKEYIQGEIKRMFGSDEGGTKISLQDGLSNAVALSLILVPEISAVVTAKMLVQLGLIDVEDAE